MPSCAHVYCRNSTKSYKAADGRRISFHRFPSEPSVRQLWLENLQREGFTPSSRSVLCSEHFKGTCFDHRAGKWSNPRLQYGAVPTLFHREGDIKKKGDDKQDESSDDEPGSWSGWHSWPEKEGSTDRQKDPSQGLKELEELMEEEEEREEIEELMEDEELEDGNEKGSPEEEKEEQEEKEEEDEEGEEKEEETGTENDIVRKVLKQAGEHDKITLDNVTMDPTLTSVRVGDQRMVSMTFQDILNSLIPAQPKDSSKEPSNPNSDEVKGHQDKPDQDTGHPSHGQEADQGDWLYQPNEATSFTPQFRQMLKRRSEAAQKAKARKEAKKKKRDEKMVLSIYRKNTMMRVIYAKDLPYICGDCGLAFTHASVLKNHVETKHDYTEPAEMKANGEISSQVVIHRDFEKGNLKTGAEVKELRKKYPKTEFCNGNGEESEQLLENIEKTIPPSDSDEGFSMGNVGGDSSVSHTLAEREGSSHKKKKKKRKRSRKPKTDSDGNAAPSRKHRDRCHRCPNYFPSLFQKKLHMAEVHGEYTSQEAAQESWKEMADGSSTLQVLKCMYCDTFFTDSANTQGHLNKHCGLDGIKCDVCEEAIKMWNEGRNMELGNLLRKYEGVQEPSQDGDDRKTMESENDGDGATGDDEKKCDEESAVYDESKEQQDPADLIRRSLERANGISNKNFFILTCFECNEQFFIRHHLVNHYRLHEKFTCKECGEEFETMTQYQEHSDEVHKVGLCQCLYCPKKFPSLGKLNFHMLGHLGLFQCIVCKITVMSKQSLEMHIRSAANDPGHKVPTDAERITYSSSNPFQGAGHLGRQFGWRGGTAKVKNISCQFCDRKFGYIHGLRKHIRCLHPNESVPMQGDGFCCDRCGIVLASKASMKAHLKTHQERTIACPKADCNAMFTTKANLSSHLKTHSRTSWRYMFKCDVCNGTYKTKHYLEIHKKSHTGQVPYACSYCGKTFRNVTHMVYHERRMHTGQLDHTCEVCGKGFADPSTLKVHTKTHASHRPFVCDFCSKDFPTELYLRAHRRVHTKPFKCSQCDEGFSQQGARRNHMRKVHGIEMPVKRIKAKDTVHNETNRDVSQMNEGSLHDIDVTEAMVIADNTDEVISLLASLS